MIVVIGLPAYAGSAGGEESVGGLAVDVAAAAAVLGSSVELVGKVGDDGAGDAVVLALGRLVSGTRRCSGIRRGPRRCCPPWQSPRSPKPRTGPPTRWRAPLSRQTRWRAIAPTTDRGSRSSCSPPIRPRGRGSRLATSPWRCATWPRHGSWSSRSHSPKWRSRPWSRARPSPARVSSCSCRPAPHPRPCRGGHASRGPRRRRRIVRSRGGRLRRRARCRGGASRGVRGGGQGFGLAACRRLRIHACAAPASGGPPGPSFM